MSVRRNGPPRIYLAANYSRAAEMRGYRNDLEDLGYSVLARWIDYHGGLAPVTSRGPQDLIEDPDSARLFAIEDIADVTVSDMFLLFTTGTGQSKGVRHTELGLALALGKRCSIIGPMENVFHSLPYIDRYPDWETFINAAREANNASSSAAGRTPGPEDADHPAGQGEPG
jgi:hypothetical protein